MSGYVLYDAMRDMITVACVDVFDMCGSVCVLEDLTAMARDGFLDICFKMGFVCLAVSCLYGSCAVQMLAWSSMMP